MAINNKKVKMERKTITLCVSDRKKTTVPKIVFETEAQKLNMRFSKMIVNS